MTRTHEECPSWCDQHSRREHNDGYVETHKGTLYVQRLPSDLGWTHWLYLTATGAQDNPVTRGEDVLDEEDLAVLASMKAPGMCLTASGPGAIPRMVSPREARELAAALIRGAEIVEASLTASCSKCGDPVVPEQAGSCVSCIIEANIAFSRARRNSLSLVGGGR